MAFTVEVELSGLCLYVINPDRQKVAVLMPDCRKRTHAEAPFHLDETPAEFHVGYVRIDAASAGLNVTAPGTTTDRADEPRYELLHRFDRQILQFVGTPTAGSPSVDLKFPEFPLFAPNLDLLPGLFTTTPPESLLMRTVLEGGTFSSASTKETWRFDTQFNPSAPQYFGQFASFATWTRRYEGNTLTLRVTDFAGATEAEFVFSPVPPDATLHVKIANLCANNPLEWSDLNMRLVTEADRDFKWLYQLFRPISGTYPQLLLNAFLPIPERKDLSRETGAADCMGATIVRPF